MSNLNLQKLCEWVWQWPWTFKAKVKVRHRVRIRIRDKVRVSINAIICCWCDRCCRCGVSSHPCNGLSKLSLSSKQHKQQQLKQHATGLCQVWLYTEIYFLSLCQKTTVQKVTGFNTITRSASLSVREVYSLQT